MRPGLAPKNRVRRLTAFLALVLGPLACLAGCDGTINTPYPTAMKYPLREDLVVETPPKDSLLYPFAEPPGRLEETIAKIPTLESGKVLDPKTMTAADRVELRKFLETSFGSPADPKVNLDDDEAKEWAEALKLDPTSLAAGSQLYRRHCLQCHGVTGDGRGPSGPWLHPHPRDYRQGVFKFISSEGGQARKPRRDDLHRTLMVGIEGTSMPSFALLPDHDLQNLISYVTHLSVRGEVEYASIRYAYAFTGENRSNTISEKALDLAKDILKNWDKANKEPIVPRKTTPPASESLRLESVKRGYNFFTESGGNNCVSCHMDFGRQAQFRYDVWGSLVRPNNLTAGVYRGGRRPIDIYWRIRGGINPCAMPGNKVTNDAEEDKIWDLVNFVQALPYPGMLPKEVKDKVYPAQAHEQEVAER